MSALSRAAYAQTQLAQQQQETGEEYFDRGFGELKAGRQDIKKAERRRAAYEAYLGSDAQLGLGTDATLSPYSTGFRYKGGSRGGQRGVTAANNLMQQAYEAAQSGNMQLADSLKAQAMGRIDRMRGKGKQITAYGMNGPIDPGGMGGPTDILMGRLVRDASELQDRGSDTTRDFMASLTEAPLAEIEAAEIGADRQISASERNLARTTRDIGLARGGARGANADVAIAARGQEQLAGQRANVKLTAGAARAAVHGQAAQKYEEFSRAWGVNAVAAAQNYIDNKAFVRDEYVNSLTTIRLAAAQLAGQAGSEAFASSRSSAQNAVNSAITAEQISAQDDGGGGWGQIVGAVVGIGLAAFTGGGSLTLATAALGASVGSTVGGGVESAALRNENVG